MSRGRGGGGGAEQVDFREREQGVDDVVVLWEMNGRLGLDDRGRWWAQIMMVEVMVEMVVVMIEEIFFCFVGIHGIEEEEEEDKRVGWVCRESTTTCPQSISSSFLCVSELFLSLSLMFPVSFSPSDNFRGLSLQSLIPFLPFIFSLLLYLFLF